MTVKFTNKRILQGLKNTIAGMDKVDGIPVKIVNEMLDNYMDYLERKVDKARENREEKRAQDDLKERVAALVTDKPQTRDEIYLLLDDEEISPAQVSNRLYSLVEDGVVIRCHIVTKDKRYVKGYRLTPQEPDIKYVPKY